MEPARAGGFEYLLPTGPSLNALTHVFPAQLLKNRVLSGVGD